ncbi:MAG: NACHT domain-containing protein [Chloroflexi bacterium]|nr:NACHT domain-containing protein [Chloroflexota bacterium]
MKFLETLAGKLTAILAFAALVIALLALVGNRIPADYRLLVYILAIGAMVIFTVQILARRAEPPTPPDEQDGRESEVSITQAIPSPEFPIVPATPIEKARADYLGALIDDFRPLSLAGMDTHSGDTKARLALEDIYVSLNTTTQVEKEKVRTKGSKTDEVAQFMGREENRPLSTLDALTQASNRRMVLLGFPGTGKSTFVRYLSLRIAQQLCDPSARRLEGWPGKPLLPVAISLGRFAETLPPDARRGAAAMLESFIKSTLESDSRMKEFAPHILSALETEGGLFLFDGLDEVANLKLRPVVVQAVESFVEHYRRNPHSRFLVTCRTYSYQDASWQLTDWPVYELALFTPEQIEQFIRVWYDLHTKLESGRAVEYAEKRTKLLAAVQPGDPRRLYEVAPSPIILTMMAIVHASYELPDSRAQVYEQCVELLLEKWQSTRSIMGRPQTRSLLAELNVPASSLSENPDYVHFHPHIQALRLETTNMWRLFARNSFSPTSC